MADSGDPWVTSGCPLKIIMSELRLFNAKTECQVEKKPACTDRTWIGAAK